MADLNKIKIEIQNESKKVEESLKRFFSNYDSLYRSVNRQYQSERVASPREDYREFFRLLQTIKRNKDLIASLLRGLSSMRPLSNFKFVEEEIRKGPSEKIISKKIKKPEEPSQESISSEFIIEPEELIKEDNNNG